MKRSMDINIFNNMEEVKMFQDKFSSLSAEEQLSMATNLFMQNRNAAVKLNQMDNAVMFKKLDYLFKVVELGTFNENFTAQCEQEIQAIMFGEPEEETEKE